jgi:two-component system chemotaxis sensor kinase CheA
VEEIVTTTSVGVRLDQVGDATLATVRGRRLPLISLADLLRVPGGAAGALAIIATRDGDYALAVDSVLDTEELVVKPAAPAVMATGFYAGQTLPDSGRPMLLLDGAGLALAAGVRFGRALLREEHEADQAEPGMTALLFEGLDGRRRLMALAAIDRVETVGRDAVRFSGGRLRLAIDGRIIPLVAAGDAGDTPRMIVLRVSDGVTEVAYAIADPLEIVTLPPELAQGDRDEVAGVALLNGEQVELLDAHALLAAAGAGTVERPLCLLAGDGSGWMETFLKPTLEGAGYRCVSRLAAGETPSVTLALDDGPETSPDAVKLTRDQGGPHGIYRYDRAALLAAVASRVARGGR